MNNIVLNVYDSSFNFIESISEIETLIWSTRYGECGDFELTLPLASYVKYKTSLKSDNFLMLDGYDSLNKHGVFMIIEALRTTKDEDDGHFVVVSGRSGSSILDYRVSYYPDWFTGNVHESIMSLIRKNFIESVSWRNITNLTLINSTDPELLAITDEKEYAFESIYDIVYDLCKDNHIGFNIYRNADHFEFTLTMGKTKNVIFSENNDNLISSDFFVDSSVKKNAMLAIAFDEIWYLANVFNDNFETTHIQGLVRREGITQVDNIQRNYLGEDGTIVTKYSDEEWMRLLAGRANAALIKTKTTFSGEVQPSGIYSFGIDYKLGDVVHINDGNGHDVEARITEVIFTMRSDERNIYLTLESNDDE